MAESNSAGSVHRRGFLKAGAAGLGGLALNETMGSGARSAPPQRIPVTPIYPRNNIGRELIPFQITNQTGRSDVYFYLVGTTEPKTPNFKWFYLSDLRGNCTRCPIGDNQTYSMPLPPSTQTIWFPRLSAIRVYFSFGKKLYLDVDANNGIPTSPAGWLMDSNFETLFDWLELTWELNPTDYTLGGNSTQVDMFGLPMELTLNGFDPVGAPLTVQGGFQVPGVRDQILQTIQAQPDPWNKLVLTDSMTGFATRVISPYHGMELNLFPRDQLQAYIDAVWTYYSSHAMTTFAIDADYIGQVSQSGRYLNQLVFTSKTRPPVVFNKPDSFTVYTSGPLPVTPDAHGYRIGATLQASFLRGTLLTHTQLPFCDSSAYYISPPVNEYAKTFHHYADGGGAYAFGFDDVCDKSSFIIVHNPTSLSMKLLKF